MPNWVMNELTCVFQTSEEYNAFKMKANTEGLFASFFPMPEVLDGTIAPHRNPEEFIAKVNQSKGTNFLTLEGIALGGNDTCDANLAKGLIKNIKAFEQTGYYDWYSWNLNNWGVKWEAKDCKAKELSDFNTIIFSFDTAWGTPELFVREMSQKYPTATFQMVSGSIENDCHYEFTCEDGNYQETCSYETFKEAVEDGKWGGMKEWAEFFEEEEV